ncbi:hypothetical protein FPOAC2_04431 [Fusarium poae]|jgi:hypothetical protein
MDQNTTAFGKLLLELRNKVDHVEPKKDPTFHSFTSLPKELRIRIYLLATPPRVVLLQKPRIRYVESSQEYKSMGPDPKYQDYTYSFTKIPALLHTCRESRCELVRHGYELTFGSESSVPLTWFDYRREALYLAGHVGNPFPRVYPQSLNEPPTPLYRYGEGSNCYLLDIDKKRVRWVVDRSDCSQYVFETGEAFAIGGGPAPFLATNKKSKWSVHTSYLWMHI